MICHPERSGTTREARRSAESKDPYSHTNFRVPSPLNGAQNALSKLEMPALQQIARHLRSAEAAEIAEAALVLPLVFLLLFGAVWFGRAYNIYSTIQQAAQQGAIVAARSSCATCTATAAPVYNTIIAVMQASNLDPSQIQLPPPPTCGSQPAVTCVACPPPFPPGGCPTPTSGSIYVCQNVQLNPGLSQPVQCGSVVSFQYPFTFNLPLFQSLNMGNIILSAQAQSRMED